MNSMNQGASPKVSAVCRANARPIVSLRALASRRAELSADQPISAAAASTRSRVAAEAPYWLFSAYEAVLIDTPARRATSEIVGRPTDRGLATIRSLRRRSIRNGADRPLTPVSRSG